MTDPCHRWHAAVVAIAMIRIKEALAKTRHAKSNRPVFAPEFLARLKAEKKD